MYRCLLLVVAQLAFNSCSESVGTEPDANPAAAATANATAPLSSARVKDTATPDPISVAQNEEDRGADAARMSLPPAIPVRFRGEYAETPEQCRNPSHARFAIRADEIQFFESTGRVRNVQVEEDSAAASVSEQHGDGPANTYVFYMRLLPEGRLRYRYDKGERRTWVRCLSSS